MELEELKKRFTAARALTVPDTQAGASFTLSVPTGLELLRIRNASDLAGESTALFNYRLVQERLLAWDGVKEKDIVADAGDGSLPFSPAAVELYLATRPGLVGRLADALVERYNALHEAQEASKKS